VATHRPLIESQGKVQEMPTGDTVPANVLPPGLGLPPWWVGDGEQLVVEARRELHLCHELRVDSGGEVCIESTGRACLGT